MTDRNKAYLQDDAAKNDTMGLGKSMNGANLPVFVVEVNRTIGLILYLAEKCNIAL